MGGQSGGGDLSKKEVPKQNPDPLNEKTKQTETQRRLVSK